MGRIPHPFPIMLYSIIIAGIGKMLSVKSHDEVIHEMNQYVESMLEMGFTISEMSRHVVVVQDCNCFVCNGMPFFYEVVLEKGNCSLREIPPCSVALAMAKAEALTAP